jgi:hypothetical protein
MSRLHPDPSVGVSDLMQPLEKFMKARNNRNLWVLLQRPVGVTWKTAPHCSWLASISHLMIDYAVFSPFLVLSSKKNRAAIEKLNSNDKVNYTKKSDDDFCDWADETIRLACKQFRDLKADAKVKERCLKRCANCEIDQINAVLDLMQSKDEATTTTIPPIPKSWEALPLEDKAPEEKEAAPIAPAPSTSIFKRVLDRKVSDASSHMSPKQHQATQSNPFITPGSSSTLSFAELQLLAETFAQNKESAEEAPKRKVAKVPKPSKTTLGAAMKSKMKKLMRPKQIFKKPSVQTTVNVEAEVAEVGEEPKQKKMRIRTKTKDTNEVLAVAQTSKEEVPLKTLRKRAVSKAYHSAYKLAVNQGKALEDAKLEACAAYKAEAKKWDEGEDVE